MQPIKASLFYYSMLISLIFLHCLFINKEENEINIWVFVWPLEFLDSFYWSLLEFLKTVNRNMSTEILQSRLSDWELIVFIGHFQCIKVADRNISNYCNHEGVTNIYWWINWSLIVKHLKYFYIIKMLVRANICFT